MTTDSTQAETHAPPSDAWKFQIYLLGALVGLAVGLLAGHFFVRVSEESGQQGPAKLKTMDALKLAISVLGLVRQVTDLGAGGGKK